MKTGLILSIFLFIVTSATAGEQIEMNLGSSRVLNLSAFANEINLGASDIVDVKKGKNKKEVILSAKKEGRVKIEIIMEGDKKEVHQILVVDNSAKMKQLWKIKKKLEIVKSLEIEVRKDHVYLTGKIKKESSIKYIEGIKKQYPGIIVDASERYVSRPELIVDTVNKVLKKNGMGNIQARNYGKFIQLVGSPKNAFEKKLALKLAQAIDKDIEDGLDASLSAAPSVSIEVMFVEISKSDSLRFGLKNEPIGGAANAHSFATGAWDLKNGHTGPISWQVTDLSFFLDLVKTSGRSRVLSQPKLVSRSGQDAKFHSGGTFFMESIQFVDGKKEIVITPVKHGIELEITPKVDRLGQIDAKLKAAVKDITEPKVEGGLPSLAVNEVDTAVTIKDGQSILLSGLLKKRNSKEVSKVPFLGDVPLLGELFKNRKMEDEEVEVVVLLTMKVQEPSKDGLAASQKLWEKAGHDVEFSIFD